jgi:hypothetical protein
MRSTTHIASRLTAAIICAAALVACGGEQPDAPPTTPSGAASSPSPTANTTGPVAGTIMGTAVTLEEAEFDGDLVVFTGDGWGWNPGLLIFLFADDDTPPEGKVISVGASDGMQAATPHVHFRWMDPEAEEIEVEAVVDGYDLRIEFGQVEDGHISGSLSFELPGQETRVSGTFRARIKSE